jgi:DNA processing protein
VHPLSTITIELADPRYPRRLAGWEGAPAVLHAAGDLGERPLVVAIVGARAASGHGMVVARELARQVAAAGGSVISGGAVGIDAAAHRGAIEAGGHTVAVMASGLDIIYPDRHRPLFDDILAAGGALLSPYLPGTPPRRGQFVARNGVIAALADAVVVVEAEPGSGSLHTASAARHMGRVVGAAPGSPGCERLLAGGDAVVSDLGDLRAALAGQPRRPHVELPERDSEEARVLAALDDHAALDQGAIAERSGLDVRRVLRALTGLELEGLALASGANYLRSPLARALTAQQV